MLLLGEREREFGSGQIDRQKRDIYCRRSELSSNEITFLPPLHFAAKPPLKSLVPSPTTMLALSLSLSLASSAPCHLTRSDPPALGSRNADSILPFVSLMFIHVFIYRRYIERESERRLSYIPLRLIPFPSIQRCIQRERHSRMIMLYIVRKPAFSS